MDGETNLSSSIRPEDCNEMVPVSTSDNVWFSNFSERDWEDFRKTAQMLMDAMGPPLPKMPPASPTEQVSLLAIPPTTSESAGPASASLPRCFICPLCKGAIVGAVTLDCGCPYNSVCAACWEFHSLLPQCNFEENELDYVWVVAVGGNEQTRCPSCQECVKKTPVPSHALDVAIHQMIQNLPPSDSSLLVQENYYERLEMWRNEILRRRQEVLESKDELLARFIQTQEQLLWERKLAKKQGSGPKLRKKFVILAGEITVAIALSLAAKVGISLLKR